VSDLIREILAATTYRKVDIEAVLDPAKVSWCSFDAEIGYVPRDVVLKDGMDFACVTYTHEPGGQRKMLNYAEGPCRINTYGDSYAQCQQVSDDESWQERLAAHIGEPVRNFGIGGHSVYTACLRARRVEATACAAPNLVLCIFDDDHVRNLDASRWIRTQWNERDRPRERAWPQHGLPWAHLRFDLSAGRFVQVPGLCRTPQDLMALTGQENFYRAFHDDQIVRLFALELGGEARYDDLEAVAEALQIKVDLRDPSTRRAGAARLRTMYGFKSTEYLLDSFITWTRAQGKKLMIVLVYSPEQLLGYLRGGERFDQVFLDYLRRKEITPVDILEKHKEDFSDFRVPAEKYIERYYIKPAAAAVFGHYSPIGNLFLAMAMKNEIVDWLEPRPPAYR
jgi:hypothetical protein